MARAGSNPGEPVQGQGSAFLVIAMHGIWKATLDPEYADRQARLSRGVVVKVPIVADYRRDAVKNGDQDA